MLRDLEGVIVYLDDMGRNEQGNLRNVQTVLKCLEEKCVRTKKEKLKFLKTEL